MNGFTNIKSAQGIINIAIDILKLDTTNKEASNIIKRLKDNNIPFEKRYAEANIVWRQSVKNQLDTLANSFENKVNEMTKKYEEQYCTPAAILKNANDSYNNGSVSKEQCREAIKYAITNNTDFNTACQRLNFKKDNSKITFTEAVKIVFDNNSDIANNFLDPSLISKIEEKIYEVINPKPKDKKAFHEHILNYFLK